MPLEFGAAVHVFLAVLLLGTLWRVTAYHFMASSNTTLQHVGSGMITQY